MVGGEGGGGKACVRLHHPTKETVGGPMLGEHPGDTTQNDTSEAHRV